LPDERRIAVLAPVCSRAGQQRHRESVIAIRPSSTRHEFLDLDVPD
jgi:hypothetical protein